MLQPSSKRVLVLFTGGLIGFEDSIASLQRLKDSGVELDVIQTPSAERILDQQLIGSLGMRDVTANLVADHDMLIIPTLTANIAAKAAHGICDCLASNLLAEFIMSNRPVVVSGSPVDPDGEGKRAWYPHMPAGYAVMLRANLQTLESFNVRVVRSSALCRSAMAAFTDGEGRLSALHQASDETSIIAHQMRDGDETKELAQANSARPADDLDRARRDSADAPVPTVVFCEEKLITQQSIQQLSAWTELHVSTKTLITALAQDTAAEQHISIIRED